MIPINLMRAKNFLLSSTLISLIFGSSQSFAVYKADRINDTNLPSYVSVFDLNTIGSLRVLQDNVESFQEKIRLIRNAKSSLDIMYYIYSNDESSSYFSQELIKAAHRGVKVRVLLDYIANYKILDTLIAIQNEAKKTGKGSIEFRLYGRPTANIIRDVIFMTTTCEKLSHDECVSHKMEEANKFINADVFRLSDDYERAQFLKQARNANSGLSGILLSGIYGKSGNTLKFIFHQLGYDKKIAEAFNSKKKMTPEEKAKAIDLIKLYIKSEKGDPRAKLLISIATAFYGDQINEVLDVLNEAIPIQLPALDSNRIKDWDYFTDYLHHKLLLADSTVGFEAVIGGRNIENSYHMQKNPSGKYTFVDTDITIGLDGVSGIGIRESFNRVWNFDTMVAPLDEVLQHAPNDTMAVLAKCTVLDEKCALGIPRTPEAVMTSRITRYSEALKALNKAAIEYLNPKNKANNTPKKLSTMSIDRSIDNHARISYIENIPFNKNKHPLVRNYGSQVDREDLSGKFIHKIWVNSMLDLCGVQNGKQTIYLHSAYVVFPTPLLSAIAEMTKSATPSNQLNSLGYRERDCSNVTIKIITNSVETTDLSVINVFARVQLHALLKTIEEVKSDPYYREHNLGAKAAHFEYYEYLPTAYDKNSSISLHSKVSIIGKNAIIGSSNADVRSYMMDSNNGIYVENAPNFVAQYTQFLEKEISNPAILQRLDLQWRQGALSPNKNYLGDEIQVLIKRIQHILQDRKWAKEKYFQTLQNIFNNVFLEEILINTVKMSTTYSNILPEEFDELQHYIKDNNIAVTSPDNHQPIELNQAYEELRRDKNKVDRLLKLF